MKTQNEKRLAAIEELMATHASEIKEIWQKAESDQRATTPEERGEVEEKLKAIETLKAEKKDVEAAIEVEREVTKISREMGKAESAIPDMRVVNEPAPRGKSLGEQFVESAEYKGLREKGLTGSWSTGQVALDLKGTLMSTPGTAPNPPQYLSGITETLFQRLTVADLLAQGSTDASSIRYTKEKTATNKAAVTDEGDPKPESTLEFEEASADVKKIATFLPVSDEMLEDTQGIQSYINERLSLFVRHAEEAELLHGASWGILKAQGLSKYARGTVDAYEVALFKAMNGARGSFHLDPDAIVMNPSDWQTIRLGTDSAGQYFGGGPFYGPYGGPQGPASSSMFSADNLWGVRVVVTGAIGSGTALVGPFRQAAQIFRRTGLTVEASNSHGDFFQHNLTAIRAEERLALAIYREEAFVQVTF